MSNFRSLGISEMLCEVLRVQGIHEPTAIQKKAIPLLMDGKDVIAQSQTGTGKTFAFVLPILEKIDPDNPSIQALIVTPTRELALQITQEVKKLTESKAGVNVLAVYGGQDVEAQLKKLKKGIQIVIATPGRLLDHIRRNTIDLSKASFLVLDEADQMLHIGFLNEVEEIISQTPKTRQTLLFSATMPDEVRLMAKRHMYMPDYIQIEKTQSPLANIKQIAISTTDRAKQNDLIETLRMHQPFLAVIFCRTKRRASKLADALKANHFNCDELHGDLSQAKREQVMKKFREAKIQYLIATDVAARGLDVDGVTHVFNYDIPQDTESYIHRIGRTGRAGSEGLAITFYAEKDQPQLKMIQSDLHIQIDKKHMGSTRQKERSEQTRKSADYGEDKRSSRTGDYKGKYTRKPDQRPAGKAAKRKGLDTEKGRSSHTESKRKSFGDDRRSADKEKKREGKSSFRSDRESIIRKDSRRVERDDASTNRPGKTANAKKKIERSKTGLNKKRTSTSRKGSSLKQK